MSASVDAIIARAVQVALERSAEIRFGEVTAVDSEENITVIMSGTSVRNVATIDSYHPVVGDWAWLLHQGSTLVCIGRSTPGT